MNFPISGNVSFSFGKNEKQAKGGVKKNRKCRKEKEISNQKYLSIF